MIQQGQFEEALWYTKKGEKIQADNGLLLHMPQFLERILSLTKQVNETEYTEWKKQADALKYVYASYGEFYETEEISLWKNYKQSDAHLISEIIKQERTVIHQSQETLASALEIDQKTISRIENGKYKPKQGTFQKLRNYLQIGRDIFTTRVVTDNFELLEIEREISKQINLNQLKSAESSYLHLRELLTPDCNENLQYMQYRDTFFAKQSGKITADEAIERCIQAFRTTRKNMDLSGIRHIVLSRREFFIINYIAHCYDQSGKRMEAIKLLEAAKDGYQKSKINEEAHYAILSVLNAHLSDDYKRCGYYEKAIAVCEEGIILELQCKRGNELGCFVEQKAYSIQRKTGDKSAVKSDYQQAYQLYKLTHRNSRAESLADAYEKQYQENIN